MKNLKILSITALAIIVIALVSCKKDNNTPANNTNLADNVSGTYSGTLKNSATNETQSATLTVSKINDSLVSMHCVAADFDTTISNLCYQNAEQVMLCFSGQDFYNTYGHNMNNYNFCNSKSNGWSSGWCDNNNCWSGEDNWNAWTNHLNTQHSQTDQHFGYFNVNGHNCDYTFIIKTSTDNYTQQFVGAIQ